MTLFSKLFSKNNKDTDDIIKMTCLFMEAAMLLLPEDMNEDQLKMAICFELGVIDYLSQCAGLGQEDTIKVTTIYFKTHRKMPVNEESILNFGVEIGETPEGARCWTIGGNAIKAWVKDGDKNAPLKLIKLIDET